ncbi:YbaB/EbfC family nucleoid-associated protein [Saccharothrix longispora]|uniref:YbaB/EbfC family nucleoid-associated protein n=1 Tax=Saccharothrix longispora TaxID=33920 RepID=UPI0028FD2A66|nr:YbaB/EbfC family nucleoid-associated protein [Saccharothrix longispora]MDU0293708.1 YbaB/EbfC family nucleoid-associated protein [Saccharothrix longispora]
MDPQQWLDNFEAKLADLQRKSADLQENFENSQATATSQDGSVTVTVGPNGGLLNLQLGHRAVELGAARLTAVILQTARTAQKQAAQKVMEAFEPLGEGTEAMRMVSDSIPDDDQSQVDDHDYAEPDPEPEPEPARATPPYASRQMQMPARPARRSPADDDDDDENQPW